VPVGCAQRRAVPEPVKVSGRRCQENAITAATGQLGSTTA